MNIYSINCTSATETRSQQHQQNHVPKNYLTNNDLISVSKNNICNMQIDIIEKISSFLNVNDLISLSKVCTYINHIIKSSNIIENIIFDKIIEQDYYKFLLKSNKQFLSSIYNKESYVNNIRQWLLRLDKKQLINNLDCRRNMNFYKALYLQIIKNFVALPYYFKENQIQKKDITDYLPISVITQNKYNNSINICHITNSKQNLFIDNDDIFSCEIKNRQKLFIDDYDIPHAEIKYATSKDQKYFVTTNGYILKFYNLIEDHKNSSTNPQPYFKITFNHNTTKKLCIDTPIKNLCFSADSNLLAVTANIAHTKRAENKIFTSESLIFYQKTTEKNWEYLLSMLSQSNFTFQNHNFTDRNTLILPRKITVIEYDPIKKSTLHKFSNVNFARFGGDNNLALTMISDQNNCKTIDNNFINKICVYQYNYNLATWEQEQILYFNNSHQVKNIIFSECGTLLSINSNRYLEIYLKNQKKWRLIKNLTTEYTLFDVEFSIDANYVVLDGVDLIKLNKR